MTQARASLSAHGQYVSHKLASLRKYSIRLDDALAWTQTIRDRITRGDLSGLRVSGGGLGDGSRAGQRGMGTDLTDNCYRRR